MTTADISFWRDLIAALAAALMEHEPDLTQLDRGVGDGDHGANIRRGFDAARQAVEATEPSTISQLFSTVSMALSDGIGGAMGPLLGAFFAGMGTAAQGIDEVSLPVFAAMIATGTEKVRNLGRACPGDKTMVDALVPAAQALASAQEAGVPLATAAVVAADAAKKGAEATVDMVARFGRAKFVGERALGHQDAGATSMAIILETIAACMSPAAMGISVADSPDRLVVRSGALCVTLAKASTLITVSSEVTGAVVSQVTPASFLDAEGKAHRLGSVRHWRQDRESVLLEVEVSTLRIASATVCIRFPLQQSCQITVSAPVSGNLSQTRLTLESTSDEHFFGLGERFGQVDQRGLRVPCWGDDKAIRQGGGHPWTYFPVPFYISTRNYALSLDTACRADLDLCAGSPEQVVIDVAEPRLRYELFFAESPLKQIDLYTQRSGRPALAPRWNNGVWHTCLGGQDAVLNEARRIREARIPCSALWVYDANSLRGNIGWPICRMHHSGHYDNAADTVSKLHDMGYRVQTYMFPYFYEDTPTYAEGAAKGYFLMKPDGSTYSLPFISAIGRQSYRRNAGIVDFTNPQAKAWWQEAVRYVIEDLGYDGWMHDFGEATPADVVTHDGRRGSAVHNIYPVMYQQAAREVCQQVKPDASFYARSGYAGSQEWLSAAWTGDQICTWEPSSGLPSALVACLSLSISGVPFIGPDIGGYFAETFESDSLSFSSELWQRWTQLGALCSVMRDHLGDKPEGSIDMWTDEATTACFARYARLHMSLSPYFQIYAREAHETGAPVMRHLFLVSPSDPRTWTCDSEYLLGASLLVAPVLEPNVRSRRVYLPEGPWVDYWDGQYYAGGTDVSLDAPLEQIPMLMRAGALLPTLLDEADTLVSARDPSVCVAGDDLNLTLFLPADWPNSGPQQGTTEVTLHDDTTITCSWSHSSIHLSIRGTAERTYGFTLPCRIGATGASAGGEAVQLREVLGMPERGRGFLGKPALQMQVKSVTGRADLEVLLSDIDTRGPLPLA